MKLYEYPTAIRDAFTSVEGAEGMTDAFAQQRIDGLKGERDQKIEHVAMHLRTLQARQAAYKAEEELFKKKRLALDGEINFFKGYLLYGLKAANLKKVVGEKLTVSLRRCPVSCDILSDAEVPLDWCLKILTYKPKKKEIIAHFKKTGEVVKGCNIVDDRETINIR